MPTDFETQTPSQEDAEYLSNFFSQHNISQLNKNVRDIYAAGKFTERAGIVLYGKKAIDPRPMLSLKRSIYALTMLEGNTARIPFDIAFSKLKSNAFSIKPGPFLAFDVTATMLKEVLPSVIQAQQTWLNRGFYDEGLAEDVRMSLEMVNAVHSLVRAYTKASEFVSDAIISAASPWVAKAVTTIDGFQHKHPDPFFQMLEDRNAREAQSDLQTSPHTEVPSGEDPAPVVSEPDPMVEPAKPVFIQVPHEPTPLNLGSLSFKVIEIPGGMLAGAQWKTPTDFNVNIGVYVDQKTIDDMVTTCLNRVLGIDSGPIRITIFGDTYHYSVTRYNTSASIRIWDSNICPKGSIRKQEKYLSKQKHIKIKYEFKSFWGDLLAGLKGEKRKAKELEEEIRKELTPLANIHYQERVAQFHTSLTKGNIAEARAYHTEICERYKNSPEALNAFKPQADERLFAFDATEFNRDIAKMNEACDWVGLEERAKNFAIRYPDNKEVIEATNDILHKVSDIKAVQMHDPVPEETPTVVLNELQVPEIDETTQALPVLVPDDEMIKQAAFKTKSEAYRHIFFSLQCATYLVNLFQGEKKSILNTMISAGSTLAHYRLNSFNPTPLSLAGTFQMALPLVSMLSHSCLPTNLHNQFAMVSSVYSVLYPMYTQLSSGDFFDASLSGVHALLPLISHGINKGIYEPRLIQGQATETWFGAAVQTALKLPSNMHVHFIIQASIYLSAFIDPTFLTAATLGAIYGYKISETEENNAMANACHKLFTSSNMHDLSKAIDHMERVFEEKKLGKIIDFRNMRPLIEDLFRQHEAKNALIRYEYRLKVPEIVAHESSKTEAPITQNEPKMVHDKAFELNQVIQNNIADTLIMAKLNEVFGCFSTIDTLRPLNTLKQSIAKMSEIEIKRCQEHCEAALKWVENQSETISPEAMEDKLNLTLASLNDEIAAHEATCAYLESKIIKPDDDYTSSEISKLKEESKPLYDARTKMLKYKAKLDKLRALGISPADLATDGPLHPSTLMKEAEKRIHELSWKGQAAKTVHLMCHVGHGFWHAVTHPMHPGVRPCPIPNPN